MIKVNAKHRLLATQVCVKCGVIHAEAVAAGRTQDWFHKLDDDVKAEYVEKYPGTKFKDKTKILHPDAVKSNKVSAKKINFKKLDFHNEVPEDFQEQFLKEFSKEEGITKLWILRRAVKSVINTDTYKPWMKAFDKCQKELEK